MNAQNLVIAAAIAFLTLVVFLVARRLLDRDQARLKRRLAFPGGEADTFGRGASWPAEPPNLARRVDRSFEDLVVRTGLGLGTGQMLGILALTALVVAALLFFWLEDEGAAALGLALGLIFPLLVLVLLRGRRQRLLQGQLPDAFYFLARSLRAGSSLEQSLTRAGEQLEEPLASEFRRCASQIELGLHPQAALQIMAERLRLADFDIFASTVSLYYQSGGNLALLLDRLAASTRDRIQFMGYFRAATALARVAGLFLGAAVPLLILGYAIWQPEHIRELFNTAAGWQMLGIVAILEIIGILWFYYLLRVDY